MTDSTQRGTWGAELGRALSSAVQWRLLLLWTLLLLLPTWVVILPFWQTLAALIDHNVHVDSIAEHVDPALFGDILFDLGKHTTGMHGAGLASLLLFVLLSPFLNGMIVASGRAAQRLGFGALLQGGWVEYGRMFRLSLWSVLPYGVLVGASSGFSSLAQKQADHAVLQSQADHASLWALIGTLVVLVLVQAIVESSRAAFVADATLRSATRALGRGIAQLVRRPISTLVFFLAASLLGLIVASLLGLARLHVSAIGVGGLLLGVVLSQLIVAALGWLHVARVYALARIAATRLTGAHAKR